MVKFVNRVKLNLTTTGTGTVTFGSVVDGFQSLADASVVDADVVRYAIESGNNYEVGTGTIGLAGEPTLWLGLLVLPLKVTTRLST